MLRDLFPWMSF